MPDKLTLTSQTWKNLTFNPDCKHLILPADNLTIYIKQYCNKAFTNSYSIV